MDERILNPDHLMTSDIEKWANCISALYGNVSKPILDIGLLIFYLSRSVGWFYLIQNLIILFF